MPASFLNFWEIMTEQSGKEPRTTLEYRGETYPFYRTNRGAFNFENSGYTIDDISKGKQSAMLSQIYHQLKDCAKRANLDFKDSFSQFIDNSETDVFRVFSRLKAESDKLKEESEKKEIGRPQPED